MNLVITIILNGIIAITHMIAVMSNSYSYSINEKISYFVVNKLYQYSYKLKFRFDTYTI